MSRDLLIVLIVGAAVCGLVALWRSSAVTRARAALAGLDGLTVEDDGESM